MHRYFPFTNDGDDLSNYLIGRFIMLTMIFDVRNIAKIMGSGHWALNEIGFKLFGDIMLAIIALLPAPRWRVASCI